MQTSILALGHVGIDGYSPLESQDYKDCARTSPSAWWVGGTQGGPAG